ncbi:MAG: hypothetical protein WA093_05255 [Minisyncoccales bacterium]
MKNKASKKIKLPLATAFIAMGGYRRQTVSAGGGGRRRKPLFKVN